MHAGHGHKAQQEARARNTPPAPAQSQNMHGAFLNEFLTHQSTARPWVTSVSGCTHSPRAAGGGLALSAGYTGANAPPRQRGPSPSMLLTTTSGRRMKNKKQWAAAFNSDCMRMLFVFSLSEHTTKTAHWRACVRGAGARRVRGGPVRGARGARLVELRAAR